MKEIAEGIFVENLYDGVLLAAIIHPKGTLMIDTPIRPDDGRSWMAALRSMGSSTDRILLNLDSHPDRMLGDRVMDTTILAHEATMNTAENRPAIFKSQQTDRGAEWETCGGLTGIRWSSPHIYFSKRIILNWGLYPIIIEHHPGPNDGACWVIIPDQKIVFIGDTVVLNQPPFFEKCNISAWLEALEELSRDYKDFKIISSRGGQIDPDDIQLMKKFLKDVQKRLDRLDKRKKDPEAIEEIAPKLLSILKYPEDRKALYLKRLVYGLSQCYLRNYKYEFLAEEEE
ncbi:MAG: hypothetical protein JXA19_01535 [Anaerolineales bacterium]|nr:hypothetical protein [Anaerolineales bacterium]